MVKSAHIFFNRPYCVLSSECTHTYTYSLTQVPPKRRFHYGIVQHSRQVAMDSVCQNSNQTWQHLTAQQRQVLAQRMVVNDEYRLLYCPVPLVGNGPWMKVMYLLAAGKDLTDISKLPSKALSNRKNFVYLNSFSPAEQERRLRSYLKFTVTRHPFLRIANAYKLKFEAENSFFHERYGKEIVQKYRKDAASNLKGNDVKFSEFVRYLSDINNHEEMNEHWQSLSTLCRPCEVGYDFLLHHETLHQDSRELLGQAELQKRIPVFPYDTWDRVSSVYVHNLFKQILPSLIGRLVLKFANDLEAFSYSSLF